MSVSKQLVNLLGIVLVVAVLVAGVALLAVPQYSQSQSTDLQVRDVTQLNGVYALQYDQLTAEKERIEEISAAVGELRTEITALPKLDDVHELVASAAADAEAIVVSTVAAEPVAWTPRTVVSSAEEGEADAAATGSPGAIAPVDGAADTTDQASVDAGAAPSEDESGNTGQPLSESAEEEPPVQQQVPVMIIVKVAHATQAAAFIEALGAGPRLIGVESAVLVDSDNGVLTLTVNALAFVRTGD